MPAESREDSPTGVGDVLTVVLLLLVALALGAGAFFWFGASDAVVHSPTITSAPMPPVAVPPHSMPAGSKAASPFADDDDSSEPKPQSTAVPTGKQPSNP